MILRELGRTEYPYGLGYGAMFANQPYSEWYLNSLRIKGSPVWEHHVKTDGAGQRCVRGSSEHRYHELRVRPSIRGGYHIGKVAVDSVVLSGTDVFCYRHSEFQKSYITGESIGARTGTKPQRTRLSSFPSVAPVDLVRTQSAPSTKRRGRTRYRPSRILQLFRKVALSTIQGRGRVCSGCAPLRYDPRYDRFQVLCDQFTSSEVQITLSSHHLFPVPQRDDFKAS